MISEDIIEFPETPITEQTFAEQGWMKIEEIEEDEENENETHVYYYYVLPLPKDNPDENCLMLISNCNDEYKEVGLPKGHYFVELEDSYGLGFCKSEEQVEILYRALTGRELYED
jgi:hypothetical protein